MHIHLVHLCLLLSGYLSAYKKAAVPCVCLQVPASLRKWDLGTIFTQAAKTFLPIETPDLVSSGAAEQIICICIYKRLTIPLVRLLLFQFLLCCDFQHRQAHAGIHPLWFVADDGTVFTWQLAVGNHSNRRGGKLSGSKANTQVMSSLPSTRSPFFLLLSQVSSNHNVFLPRLSA